VTGRNLICVDLAVSSSSSSPKTLRRGMIKTGMVKSSCSASHVLDVISKVAVAGGLVRPSDTC
jgi:hypothetical protein